MSDVKSDLYTHSMEMISLIEEIKALGVNPKQEARLDQLEDISESLKTMAQAM